jgi:hypothetical protein
MGAGSIPFDPIGFMESILKNRCAMIRRLRPS